MTGPAQVTAGQAGVVFTATLSPPAGAPAPTGTVTFELAAQGSGSGPQWCPGTTVSGLKASCTITMPSTTGTYFVDAFYSGSSAYVPSQGYEAVQVGASGG